MGNCALNTIVPNFKLFRKLLRYALLRIKSSSQELDNKSFFILDELQSKLHKLATFCLLYNVFDELTWSENTEVWIRFSKQSVNNICLDLIQKV